MKINTAGTQALPEGFLELPPLVYGDDPMWIPEEPHVLKATFGPDNPWFADAESAAFCIPGKARLATFYRSDMNDNGKPAVYFGYWETMGDPEADDAIFEAATEWALQRGVTNLCGPINFSTFGDFRIRTRVEEGGLTFGNEPYNPSIYESILVRQGFERVTEAVTQITPSSIVQQIMDARKPQIDQLHDAGFRFEPFTHEMFLDRLPYLHKMVETMFNKNWGYTAPSYELFAKSSGKALIRKTDPESNIALFDAKDKLIGFFLVYPHWGPLICQSAGDDRVPLSEIDYDTHWPQLLETGTVWAVPKTTAILPEYQGKGLFAALALMVAKPKLDVYTHWYGALTGATKNNRKLGEKLSHEARWYAAFGKAIA